MADVSEELSILDSVKKTLMVDLGYDIFDDQIKMHINSVFFTLNQLGVGPSSTFEISSGDESWSEFIGQEQINAVKSYMFLKVKLLFDPPTNSFTIESMNKQITEYDFRLSVQQEESRWKKTH